MITFIRLTWLPLLLCLVPFCVGKDLRDIKWTDLAPVTLIKEEQIMAQLSEEHRGMVEWLIYLQQNLPPEAGIENEALKEEVTEALPLLKEKGLDLDKIIAARHQRNTSINQELNGKLVRLSGYLLPLEAPEGKIAEFLLVPYFGACIHVPPPPPNQIVHGSIEDIKKRPKNELFKPVYATGVMKAKSLSKDLSFVDGSSDIDIGYSMQVHNIEPYKQEKW